MGKDGDEKKNRITANEIEKEQDREIEIDKENREMDREI